MKVDRKVVDQTVEMPSLICDHIYPKYRDTFNTLPHLFRNLNNSILQTNKYV